MPPGFVYVSIYLYLAHTRADGCGSAARRYTVWFAHLVNISFLVLFAQFFNTSYSKKAKVPGVNELASDSDESRRSREMSAAVKKDK